MDWCYRHTRHSAEGSLRDGETYCCPDETRVRGGNHRVRHGKTSLLRGNECVRDGNECFHEGDNGVRLDEGSVRGAQSSVRGGNDFFRLSKNHFRLEQNHFRHGKDPRRAANDLVRNGKESVRDGKDRGRHIDDHLWDGENRLAGGLHPRCDGNHFHEVIGDCMRNGNHYRRDFNKPVWLGNDRGDSRSIDGLLRAVAFVTRLNGTPCSIPNGMSVCLFFNGLK